MVKRRHREFNNPFLPEKTIEHRLTTSYVHFIPKYFRYHFCFKVWSLNAMDRYKSLLLTETGRFIFAEKTKLLLAEPSIFSASKSDEWEIKWLCLIMIIIYISELVTYIIQTKFTSYFHNYLDTSLRTKKSQ